MDESILFSSAVSSSSRECVCGCVCVSGVDLAAILSPLWVNRKKGQLMKYAEYITLEDKFFSFLT